MREATVRRPAAIIWSGATAAAVTLVAAFLIGPTGANAAPAAEPGTPPTAGPTATPSTSGPTAGPTTVPPTTGPTSSGPGSPTATPTTSTTLITLEPPGPMRPGLTIAKRFANVMLQRWPDPARMNPAFRFEYGNGTVLHALSQVYLETGDKRYLEFIRIWADACFDADGKIVFPATDNNLDYIQPGNVMLFLYEQTGVERYRDAARQVWARLSANPRNAFGGWWHKDVYPNQMWADSAYMGYRFAVAYGLALDDPKAVDEGVRQALLFTERAQQPNGLVRHGWDASRTAVWADPQTGLSPYVWTRGTGWYAMALADILAILPSSHPGYRPLRAAFVRLAAGIVANQDPRSGLWLQLPELPTVEGNFPEVSGSTYMIYALLRGVERGLLPERYREPALKAWAGLGPHIWLANTGWKVEQNVEGMGVGPTLAHYTTERRRFRNTTQGLMGIQLAGLLVATADDGDDERGPVAVGSK